MHPLFTDGLDVGDVAGLIGGGISLGTYVYHMDILGYPDLHQYTSPYLFSLLSFWLRC